MREFRRVAARTWLGWFEDPKVALATGAVGALLGIAFAGYGLFTAQGATVRGVPAEDIALVNGVPILRSDLVAQIESSSGKRASQVTDAERQRIIDDMIREELLVQRGLELGEPATDPDTRAALAAAVQQQIAVDATSAIPADGQLRKFYDAHRATYSSIGAMTVRDLVPRDPATTGSLAEAAAALRHGLPVEVALARYGLKESGKVDGEELYFAASIHLGDVLFAVAERLHDGEVGGPIIIPDGSHVLVMVHDIAPRPRPFEVVRNQVYNDYKADLERRLRDGEYRYLRGKADIHLADDAR